MSFIKRPVPSIKSHTHLGLTLSTDLRFHDHINNVNKKVNIALTPYTRLLTFYLVIFSYNYTTHIFYQSLTTEISFMTD